MPGLRETLSKWREWWKVAALSSIITLLLTAFPNWYPILKEWRYRTFQVTLGPVILVYGAASPLNMVRCTPKGLSEKPIHLAVSFKVRNNDQSPIEVVGYALEVKSDHWKRPSWLELGSPFSVEWHYPGDSPKYLDFSKNGFDILAREGPLQPGHSLEGWVFFSWGLGSGLNSATPITRLRITFFDSKGEKTAIEEDVTERQAQITTAYFDFLPSDWKPPCTH